MSNFTCEVCGEEAEKIYLDEDGCWHNKCKTHFKKEKK